MYAQLGALLPSAPSTFAGLTLGALAYSVADPHLAPARTAVSLAPKGTLYERLGLTRAQLAAVLVPALGGVVYAVERFSPSGLPAVPPLGGALSTPRWHPVLCGVLIGSLQVPLTLVLRKNAGCSSSFVTTVATVCNALGGPLYNKYLEKKRTGMGNWWQVVFMGGAVLGAYLSLRAAGGAGVSSSPVSATHAVLGGALVLAGSRFADGCTAGHGISGMGHMGLRSMAATAAMFAGGVVAVMVV